MNPLIPSHTYENKKYYSVALSCGLYGKGSIDRKSTQQRQEVDNWYRRVAMAVGEEESLAINWEEEKIGPRAFFLF